jgi:hypothetical protein
MGIGSMMAGGVTETLGVGDIVALVETAEKRSRKYAMISKPPAVICPPSGVSQ